MAVFRIEKNSNYTIMSNFHLRDKNLSCKACGLLSKMLSLPEEWDYTTRGLAAICKDGVDAIGSALKELELCGYLVRNRRRDDKGRITDVEYVIYEDPHLPCPDTATPHPENPDMGSPHPENPAQINKDKINTDQSITDELIPSIPSVPVDVVPFQKRRESKDMTQYRKLVMENIGYEMLRQEYPYDRDRLDEIVELIVETICSTRRTIRVAGSDFPAEAVHSRLLKLNSEHIRFVFDCLRENTTKIRNIKQYLLTTLFNAPVTIDHYYTSLVNHDLNRDG